MRRSRIVATTASVALAATAFALVPATEAAAPKPRTLAKQLVAPLSLAVADDGTAFVSQNFAGLLSRVTPGEKPEVVYSVKKGSGNEVGGVSERNGIVVFTETKSDGEQNPVKSWVKWISEEGRVRTLADIRGYENKRNPDGRVTYGLRGASDECTAQWPQQLGPASYRGIKDSHPYATYQTDRIYVADAGMNAVLSVSRTGKVRTVAVLPPARVRITADLQAGMLQQGIEVPDCAVGRTYYGEPVPTDVEVGRGGQLYVTTEGGGFGEQLPLGALYRVDPDTGTAKRIVGGLFAPVGLAIADDGDTFVSELFGNAVVRVAQGTRTARRFARTTMPAALDWTGGSLYATTHVLPGDDAVPAGRLVRFRD